VTAPGPEPALGEQWRSLTRTATLVALLTAPVAFVWFHSHNGLALRYALLLTLVEVAAFRGLVDVLFRRFIASPSLFGEEREELRAEDVVMRRRLSFWRFCWRWAWRLLVVITLRSCRSSSSSTSGSSSGRCSRWACRRSAASSPAMRNGA
jgi:hypothetical protein